MANDSKREAVAPLRWQDGRLWVLDQRLLPRQQCWMECSTVESVVAAIAGMAVRGAPAIGLAGAYGMVLAVANDADVEPAAEQLKAARPTAVHLAWAVDWMLAECRGGPLELWQARAERLHAEDAELNLRMAIAGANLLPARSRVITHCNTGALATGGWGTALGVIRIAHARGNIEEVLAGETRPWLQGARLTAWELQREQIPYRLVTDGAMAWAMKSLKPSWVIVGADRIAANGDTANKVGTFSLATLARSLGVKVMVVAPEATIDRALPSGADIPIEERPASEVTEVLGMRIAPEGATAWNPVFDVTPYALIDAIVTENGVVEFS